MRAQARSGLLALSAVAATVVTNPAARAQAPARPAAAAPGTSKAAAPGTTKAAAPAQAQAPARPPAELATPVATVNGEAVTKGELLNFLNRYQIPAGSEEQAYRDATETLVNTHLVNQFLARQRIPVTDDKVTQAVDTLKKQLGQDGTDLATEILRSGMSMDDVRKEYANRIRWVEYLNSRATKAELQKFAASHKDLFSGTQVKASHILVKLDPKASAADKEKARQKLLGLKRDIETNKTTFAEAANKNSDDPANAEGAGGDVGYFTLNSGFIEEFANAAFAMKKGSISDPVETPYGYHLIQVTDRKEGTPLNFEQNEPFVKQMYAADLQKALLQSERKKAKIDVKPMPADLFPPAPAQPAATATPATGAAPARTAPPAARLGTPK